MQPTTQAQIGKGRHWTRRVLGGIAFVAMIFDSIIELIIIDSE